MRFNVMTIDGATPGLIEVGRADLAGGGAEIGWQLATSRLQEAGFDVLDWRTEEDGERTLVVSD